MRWQRWPRKIKPRNRRIPAPSELFERLPSLARLQDCTCVLLPCARQIVCGNTHILPLQSARPSLTSS